MDNKLSQSETLAMTPPSSVTTPSSGVWDQTSDLMVEYRLKLQMRWLVIELWMIKKLLEMMTEKDQTLMIEEDQTLMTEEETLMTEEDQTLMIEGEVLTSVPV